LKILDSSWENMPEVRARIDQLVMLGEDPVNVREALRPGAELMAARWREKVPSPDYISYALDQVFTVRGDDHPYATGRYRDSIQVVASEFDDDLGIGWDIFTDAVNPDDGTNYPELLEMGTSTMQAQPSAQPAFDETWEQAVEMAAAALDAMILARTGGL
jgi:HK97 gp10 family phage protein